ncbi:hypothetical protein HDE_05656 [Halotydeus destructor]|nr:hypothetical protein HDE_05656 [Halotydeus destructor]
MDPMTEIQVCILREPVRVGEVVLKKKKWRAINAFYHNLKVMYQERCRLLGIEYSPQAHFVKHHVLFWAALKHPLENTARRLWAEAAKQNGSISSLNQHRLALQARLMIDASLGIPLTPFSQAHCRLPTPDRFLDPAEFPTPSEMTELALLEAETLGKIRNGQMAEPDVPRWWWTFPLRRQPWGLKPASLTSAQQRTPRSPSSRRSSPDNLGTPAPQSHQEQRRQSPSPRGSPVGSSPQSPRGRPSPATSHQVGETLGQTAEMAFRQQLLEQARALDNVVRREEALETLHSRHQDYMVDPRMAGRPEDSQRTPAAASSPIDSVQADLARIEALTRRQEAREQFSRYVDQCRQTDSPSDRNLVSSPAPAASTPPTPVEPTPQAPVVQAPLDPAPSALPSPATPSSRAPRTGFQDALRQRIARDRQQLDPQHVVAEQARLAELEARLLNELIAHMSPGTSPIPPSWSIGLDSNDLPPSRSQEQPPPPESQGARQEPSINDWLNGSNARR